MTLPAWSTQAHVMQERGTAKDASSQASLARTLPWRQSKPSFLIDAVLTELLPGHELLCASQFYLEVSHGFTP